MKSTIISSLVFAGLMSAASVASADELLVTGAASEKARGTSHIALDIVSDGQTRGFDFVIQVPKGAKVDTTKCMSALPKGFQGSCQFNGTEITGLAFSWEPIVLEKGVHSIGTVSISGVTLQGRNAPVVTFSAADVKAQPLNSAAKVSIDVESGGAVDARAIQ